MDILVIKLGLVFGRGYDIYPHSYLHLQLKTSNITLTYIYMST